MDEVKEPEETLTPPGGADAPEPVADQEVPEEQVPESDEVSEVEETPDQVVEGAPLGEPEATIGAESVEEARNLPEPGQVTS